MTVSKGTLETSNGEILYPHTAADVVFDTDNKSVSQKFKETNRAIEDLKDNVSRGKDLIAAAITDMGVPTSGDSSWLTFEYSIKHIKGATTATTAIEFTIGGGAGAMIEAGEHFYPFRQLGVPDEYKFGPRMMGWLKVVIDADQPILFNLLPYKTSYLTEFIGDSLEVVIDGSKDIDHMLDVVFDAGCCNSIGAFGCVMTCAEYYSKSSGSEF